MINNGKILEKLGLSESEIAVYVSGLEMGPSLASAIARKAKINRVMTYHLLDSLEEKGLVKKSDSRNRKLFTMEDPGRLKMIFERKKKEFEEAETEIDLISTELKSLHTPKQYPSKIYFYEGEEGVKNVLQDMLEAKNQTLYALVSINTTVGAINKEFTKYWLKEMEKRDIKRKSIWSKPIKETPFEDSNSRELRIAPSGVEIDSNITLYNNKIAVMSASPKEDPIAFVIEDKNFYNTMKTSFEALWKISKPSK